MIPTVSGWVPANLTVTSEVQVKKIRSTAGFGEVKAQVGTLSGVGVRGGCTSCLGVMLFNKLGPEGRKHGGLTPSIRREEPRWSYRKKKRILKNENKLIFEHFPEHLKFGFNYTDTCWLLDRLGLKVTRKKKIRLNYVNVSLIFNVFQWSPG